MDLQLDGRRALVTVNSVLPGPTLSEGVGTFLQQLAKEEGITVAEVETVFRESASLFTSQTVHTTGRSRFHGCLCLTALNG